MKTLLRLALIFLLSHAAAALAQESPITTHQKHVFGGLKKIVLRSAEIVPEEHYAFKPAESVRTFGQIVGHIADAQYFMCSSVLGRKNPSLKIEQTMTTKAELIAALKEAFAYCDQAYEGLTDVSGAVLVKSMGGEKPKLGILTINIAHATEHYGNLVTYMRMKNIVPPTSEPAFMKELSQ